MSISVVFVRERGVPEARAGLLGRVAVVCFHEALTRWLAQEPPARTLGAEPAATFDELRANLDG